MLLLIPGLLDGETVAALRASLDGAPFTDGTATAMGRTKSIKHNTQLLPTHPVAAQAGQTIVSALNQNPRFVAAALPEQMLMPMFARYEVGMRYGLHLDLPLMGTAPNHVRTDLSLTVFLSAPEECEGGELVLHTEGMRREVKGEAGDAILYPSDTLHEVAEVTSGARVVGLMWVQSLVRDPRAREILFDLTASIDALALAGADQAELDRLLKCRHNLMRRWART